MKFNFPSDYSNLSPAHEKILTQSEKILGKKGISGLELKNIASTLNIAPSTINYYYKNGEELIFDTVIFSYQKYIHEVLDESEGIADPEIVLRIWIDHTFAWTTSLPGIGVILEFPRQVLKIDKKSPTRSDALLKQFSKSSSKLGIANVAFLCSAIRALQKKQNFKLLKPAQVALLIAKDSKFATFCSVIGFATLGGGLWVAGRQPGQAGTNSWRSLGFNPQKQMKDSVAGVIKLLKSN